MLGWWCRKNSEDNRPVFVVDRQERLSSSLCSLSYLTLFECLRKWDGASELRVAVVTDVGVISPPASLSFGSYWLNRVCILPGYAAITPWQFQVSCIWLLTGVHQVLSCDGGGYGCVSYLAFLAMSLWCLTLNTWKQNLLLLPEITLPVILNQSY